MFVTVINDCQSFNEVGRQETRLSSLLNSPVTFMGVDSDFSVNATLEAAGNLVDVLDAAEGREGVVLVNVAPRGEQKKDGHNGTSFGYFRYQKTLVITTVRGHSLSLVKKLGLADTLKLVDVQEVAKFALDQQLISKRVHDYLQVTQFRSFDFTPRLAAWLTQGFAVPATDMSFAEIEDIPNCVWYVDAFGNCKTTLLNQNFKPGEKIKTSVAELNFYAYLKDLPKGETAMYVGSSGIEDKRFLELATQMTSGSAAKALGISVGTPIEILG
jgi:hypothetical protein